MKYAEKGSNINDGYMKSSMLFMKRFELIIKTNIWENDTLKDDGLFY